MVFAGGLAEGLTPAAPESENLGGRWANQQIDFASVASISGRDSASHCGFLRTQVDPCALIEVDSTAGDFDGAESRGGGFERDGHVRMGSPIGADSGRSLQGLGIDPYPALMRSPRSSIRFLAFGFVVGVGLAQPAEQTFEVHVLALGGLSLGHRPSLEPLAVYTGAGKEGEEILFIPTAGTPIRRFSIKRRSGDLGLGTLEVRHDRTTEGLVAPKPPALRTPLPERKARGTWRGMGRFLLWFPDPNSPEERGQLLEPEQYVRAMATYFLADPARTGELRLVDTAGHLVRDASNLLPLLPLATSELESTLKEELLARLRGAAMPKEPGARIQRELAQLFLGDRAVLEGWVKEFATGVAQSESPEQLLVRVRGLRHFADVVDAPELRGLALAPLFDQNLPGHDSDLFEGILEQVKSGDIVLPGNEEERAAAEARLRSIAEKPAVLMPGMALALAALAMFGWAALVRFGARALLFR